MITTEPRRLSLLVLAGLVCVALSTATAPAASAAEPDRAEALFQRARALMDRKEFAAACPMLEEAYALDHGGGTLLAMALCHEASGKLALALREYRESLSSAVQANRPDRVMLAESHVQQLEAKVPRIALRFAAPPPPSLVLQLDGAPVPRTTMLTGAAVDPGRHTLAASAPGFVPWRGVVDVAASSGPVVVDVPPFASTAPTLPPPPVPAPPSRSLAPGLVVGGLGLAAVGVGSYFGVAAFDAEASSRDHCHATACSQEGVNYNHDASRDALVADVTLGIGAAALVAAVYLLLRKPSESKPAPLSTALTHLAPAGRAGLGLSMTW
jgi:hypothetical protein